MIVPLAVDLKLRQARPVLSEVAERVRSIITRHFEGTGYAFIGRAKQADSLAEKIETGRFERWSELDDLYGCSIIVPTLNDEPPALTFLQEAFRTVGIRRRGSSLKDPSSFRFDSTRFIGTLQPTLSPEPPDALSRQRFEVQVRTAFEHAWAVATHKLVYKGESVDWRKLRLLAQLKSASEQLDNLILGFDKVSELILEESWPEVAHKKKIEQSIRARVAAGDIPAECSPASWVRFSDNVYALLRGTAGKRYVDEKAVETALGHILQAIDSNKGDKFPRSISLLQFVLGALTEQGFVHNGVKNYHPMVTQALRSVFPSVSQLTLAFDFELPGV